MRWPWERLPQPPRLSRSELELRLVLLCDRFSDLFLEAFVARGGPPERLFDALQWAVKSGLVSHADEKIWRDALALRSAILAGKFRIVLSDIRVHNRRLELITAGLPARVAALPPPESNVRYLR